MSASPHVTASSDPRAPVAPDPRADGTPDHHHTPGAGRYAPSPSGDLHLGNVRTGVLAYLFAITTGRRFLWRVEDLDRVQAGAAEAQRADLESLGVVTDPPVLVQSTRTEIYAAHLAGLEAGGHVFECYCSRKDIQQAASAPHMPPGAYPGTCRDLPESRRASARERLAAQGRTPALRLRTDHREVTVDDLLLGPVRAHLDDFVLRRGDGVYAYNFAAVLDDGLTGVDQVVRADDLASSAPRQAHLAELLGFALPTYAHVPLVLGPTGARLAKRDGAVTLRELRDRGFDVWGWLGESLGCGPWTGMDHARETFDPDRLTREPTTFRPESST
ncbi:tRNA glutamyl-Q(34) synthetase GluQRS [Brevibacterium litoralis]|uniref:tRNA glutamyl-Q(34) synthetase GluQRS n=1 Tax=Brevibacterium litoralis TaxID=3138935 RepID=UPI0032EDA796